MRRLLSILTIVLLSFVMGSANGKGKGHDDHDDAGPVQAGYAVITSSATSGMVVFETFGMRKGVEATQAGILPPGLTTNAILFVDSNGKLSKNLGVAIVNPNSSSVNVTLTLRSSNGTQLGTTDVSVASHQQISKFVTEMFASHAAVPKDVTGMLSITSTAPVSVIGLRFRGANFSTLPVTSLAGAASLPTIASGVGGAGAVLLPQFAAGGGWATEIVIANTSTASMTVRVDLFKQDGTALTTSLNSQSGSSFTSIVIPAGGVFVIAPRNGDGDDDF